MEAFFIFLKYFFKKNAFCIEIFYIFAAAFRIGMMSSGVMAALQILVLPVKVRILARQHLGKS